MQKSGFMSSGYGLGRSFNKETEQDTCVISRLNNMPELIFNQNYNQDKSVNKRYFEQDFAHKWGLLDNNDDDTREDCNLCHYRKYTLVFYERSEKPGANPELVEIHDSEFLKKLRAEYYLKYS